ncbi:MAG TPA: GNAT family N-acetyltransferase [Planctomycetota bacterium]|nr:GNAT family N-acetyltransferase [Planctomycetota bacterium]
MRSTSEQATLQRARALMERCLRKQGPSELAREYPLVFDQRFSGRIVAREEDGDVRSACAMLVRDLVVGHERLRVGLIGSVATDPAWRGRGLASRVLEEAENLLAREGCAAALLWADDPEFYARRGYVPAGRELDFVVPTAALAPITSDATLRALAPDDVAAVHRLYSRHTARCDRTPAETAALLGCPGMTTLVLQRRRDVTAYACLGRGADFAGTVHEWGGAHDDVVALVAEHARRAARATAAPSIALIAPPDALRLRARMEALGADVREGVLGMAKLLDPEVLGEMLERCGGTLRAEHDSGAGSTSIVRGPRGARALGEAAVLAILFGSRECGAARAELEASLGCNVPVLALSPFVWGLDSI